MTAKALWMLLIIEEANVGEAKDDDDDEGEQLEVCRESHYNYSRTF